MYVHVYHVKYNIKSKLLHYLLLIICNGKHHVTSSADQASKK